MRAELTGFPSIDKLWLKYYGEEVLHRPLPEGSMYDYLTSCNVDQLDSACFRLKQDLLLWTMNEKSRAEAAIFYQDFQARH